MILGVEDVVESGNSSETGQGTIQSLDNTFERVGNSGAWLAKDRIRVVVSKKLEQTNKDC